MSDIDPDLPDYLVDAILSQAPPAEAVDLIKNAFTWRTIDAELMELSYDSALDEVGVRDPNATRVIEVAAADVAISIEIDQGVVRGQVSPAQAGTLRVHAGGEVNETDFDTGGAFVLATTSGPLQLSIRLDDTTYELPVIAVD